MFHADRERGQGVVLTTYVAVPGQLRQGTVSHIALQIFPTTLTQSARQKAVVVVDQCAEYAAVDLLGHGCAITQHLD